MRNPYQLARLFGSFTRMTFEVGSLERVLEINDALIKLRGPDDARALVENFREAPWGASALRERPRLGRLDPSALAALPGGTLGASYGRFMLARGLDPGSLPTLPADSEDEYVIAHMLETHDLWHVVTGFDTDLFGEIALQAFYLAQHRAYLPFFSLSAVLLNTALVNYPEKAQRLDAMSEGWQMGKRAERLVGMDWRAQFERPLHEVRKDLNLVHERASGGVVGDV